ncbi:MAG: hypothetical protein AAGA75_09965 [Cyanobacteria bacterium P01_E01_bin.6]
MPYITAKKNTLLAPKPESPHEQPLKLLSKVYSGGHIGVTKVTPVNQGFAEITLAGPYTWHDDFPTIETGVKRYINPQSWTIPDEAWENKTSPQGTSTIPISSSGRLLPREVSELNHYYEGCQVKLADGRIQAYPDPASGDKPITIGWGSTYHKNGAPIKIGEIITQAEADDLYDFICYEDFWVKLQATIPYWDEMTDKQRAALTSFAYNNGASFYNSPKHNTITRNLKEKAWQAVPGTMMMYRNPGTNVEVGLGRRRYAEAMVWCGEEPADACQKAVTEIKTANQCESIEQRLKRNPPAIANLESPVVVPTASSNLTVGSRTPQVISGMLGPKSHPDAHGFKQGDYHLIANDSEGKIKCYSYDDDLIWDLPCLCRGQFSDNYFGVNGDTPPGLYKCGTLYHDYKKSGKSAGYVHYRLQYGWCAIDLVELENQEAGRGRAGIMIHGGGSACGWPGAWQPRQKLYPTLGCIRMYNQDMHEKVMTLFDKKDVTVFVSVYQ